MYLARRSHQSPDRSTRGYWPALRPVRWAASGRLAPSARVSGLPTRPWMSSALQRAPTIGVHGGVQGTPPPPAVSFEVRYGLQMADRTQAELGNRADTGRDARQFSQELLPVERHPADTELLDGG